MRIFGLPGRIAPVVVIVLAGVGAMALVEGKRAGRVATVQVVSIVDDPDGPGGHPGSSMEGLRIADGTVTIQELAERAGELGRAGALRGEEEALVLTVPLEIGHGGTLDVHGVELRMESGEEGLVGVHVDGGTLDVESATIRSWDGSRSATSSRGRAYLVATANGRIEIDASTVESLGYDTVGRRGIEVVGSSLAVRDSRIVANASGIVAVEAKDLLVEEAEIEGPLRSGVTVEGCSGRVDVRNSTVQGGSKHGVSITGCRDARVHGNDVRGGDEYAVLLGGGSDGATCSENRVEGSAGSGIAVESSDDVEVVGNLVWSNEDGISLSRGADRAAVSGNTVSSSRRHGLRAEAVEDLVIRGNRFEHNAGAGVSIETGSAEVGPGNEMTGNLFGMNIGAAVSRVRVSGNTLESSSKDGVALEGSGPYEILGNEIRDNRLAAFSVTTEGDADAYFAGNDIGEHRLGDVRVREG